MPDMRTTTASPVSGHSSQALQRGKACLRCRKRKMRCDGGKPSCQQCTKAKKGDQCQYDDGQGKTRTQLMREHITRLEQRIRELEDPEHNSSSMFLFDPLVSSMGGSSSSSEGASPTTTALTSATGPAFFDRPTTPYVFQYSASPPPPSNGIFDVTQPSLELAHLMLDIVIPHRRQLGIELDLVLIRDSLSLADADQHHPVLLNALYLWACFLSRPGPLAHSEPHYLRATLDSLNDALQHSTRLMDTIQATCLLSLYFYSVGRITEASYHQGAAASLAVRWELHRAPVSKMPTGGCFSLNAPKDTVEEGQRICAFWMVYNLDRCWSTVMNRLPCIPADQTSTLLVDVPWPQPVEDYQNFRVDECTDYDTIKAFLNGQSTSTTGFSMPAIRAKASALFAGAAQASSEINGDLVDLISMSPSLMPELASLESTVQSFLAAMPPVATLDSAVPEIKHMLIVVRSLGLSALIKLAEPFASVGSPVAHQSGLRAAREMVEVIRSLNDTDYEFLEPVLGATWLLAATILFREVSVIETAWPMSNGSASTRAELQTVLFAMTLLSQRFPILTNYASQIQSGLAAI